MQSGDSTIRDEFEAILSRAAQMQFTDAGAALKYSEEAATIARTSLGKDDIVLALNKLAGACLRISHFEDCITYAQEALSLLDETVDGLQYAKVMYTIGGAKSSQGKYSEALDYYLKVLSEFKKFGNEIRIGHVLNCIGIVYYDTGIFDEALDYFIQSEKLLESDGEDILYITGLSMNIANVLLETGRISEAMERYRQSLEIFREINNLAYQGTCLFNLSECTIQLDRTEETRDNVLEYRRISELLGDERAIAKAICLEGKVRYALGDLHGALWSSMCSLEKFKAIGDNVSLIDQLTSLAQIKTDLGSLPEAEEYLNKARKIAEDLELKNDLTSICFELAKVLESQSRFKEALDCYKTAYENEKEILGEKQRNRISSLHVIHEVEKSRQEAEINYLKNVELAKYKDDLEKLVSERTAELRKEIQEHQKTEKEKAEIESHLIRSQRLSDLARLTGGVTHDFNNLLTVVMAYSELAQSEDDPQTRFEHLNKVIEAGQLGSELAGQLLSFSRMQPRVLSSFDLSDTIRSTFRLLDRLMVGDVTVELDIQPDVGTIFGDKTMISQVVINLCINAGDAMPDGGVVNIKVFRVPGQEIRGSDRGESFNDFVEIEVSDHGTGMPPGVLEKIFDPYFTTKGPGKGTGLGLSVVYGIVEQHKGRIDVESEEGKGTTFRIYLPLSAGEIDLAETREVVPVSLAGTGEYILLVEDQNEIRKMLTEVLRASGYIVSAACSVEEAIQVYSSQSNDFDLVFIDLFLPDGSGTELAEIFLQKNPEQRILFGSGYAKKPEDIDFIERNHYKLIRKPYRISELKKEIRKALDAE